MSRLLFTNTQESRANNTNAIQWLCNMIKSFHSFGRHVNFRIHFGIGKQQNQKPLALLFETKSNRTESKAAKWTQWRGSDYTSCTSAWGTLEKLHGTWRHTAVHKHVIMTALLFRKKRKRNTSEEQSRESQQKMSCAWMIRLSYQWLSRFYSTLGASDFIPSQFLDYSKTYHCLPFG